MALSKNTADNPFPWTWALGRVATAAEAAGNGPGIDIDILGSMAVVAEDEGKVRMEDCALVGHWEEGWRVAPVVRWVGESSWSYGGRVKRLSAQQSLFLMSTWQRLSGTVISLWMRYIARDTLYVSLSVEVIEAEIIFASRRKTIMMIGGCCCCNVLPTVVSRVRE